MNNLCLIKLYDINRNLSKVILNKGNKFIRRLNMENIPLDKNEHVKLLKEVKWNLSDNDYKLDLDDNYLSVEFLKNDKLIEVIYLDVRSGILMKNFDDLFDRSYNYNLNNNLETIVRFYDINNNITKNLKISANLKENYGFGGSKYSNKPIMLYDNKVKYLEVYKGNFRYKLMQKNKLYYSISIPYGMNGIYSYKIGGEVKFANKVVRNSDSKVIKVYDENNTLLSESEDESLHNYIIGIEMENYQGSYTIEYYPKNDCRIFRLDNSYEFVDTIIEEDLEDVKQYMINSDKDKVLFKISKKELYDFEIDRTSMLINYPDNKYLHILPDNVGEF